MKSFFFKSNLILYFTHFLNFIFGYLFILICTNYLSTDNAFQFTGFVSLLNIFLIPVSCLAISLTGLYKNGKMNKQNYSIIYSKSIFFFLIIVSLIFILEIFFNLNKFIKINEKYYFLIILLLFINLFFSLENAENLANQKFLKYSIINSTPFIIRVILIFILLVLLNKKEFYLVILVYILSFSFLFKDYLNRFFTFCSIKNIYKKNMSENFYFFKNILTLSIFTIVINIDVIACRYIDPVSSTNYYIESLFGKIVFFLSSIAVLFLYPTNIQGERKNFFQIIIFNSLVSLLLMVFYFFFFDFFAKLLFPNIKLDIRIVLLISSACLLFSISNLFSYKLNISGVIIHSSVKLLLTFILIPLLFFSKDINNLIYLLIIFGSIFTLVDLYVYFILKNKLLF